MRFNVTTKDPELLHSGLFPTNVVTVNLRNQIKLFCIAPSIFMETTPFEVDNIQAVPSSFKLAEVVVAACINQRFVTDTICSTRSNARRQDANLSL